MTIDKPQGGYAILQKPRCRRKLLARPLGLRCDTEYVQPHLLGFVIAKFMIGTVGSTAEKWASYLRGNAAVETLGAEVSRYMDAIPDDQKAPYAAALAVHFLARRQEELLTPLAATLNEAAGTAGIHRWSLILPSSARVSLLTYQTVIGVRYLELVKYLDGEHRFGRFLTDFSAKRGGFLPILWDAPKSDTYAVQDIGMVVDHLRGIFTFTNNPEETLAVLQNKNRLVHAFCRSGWIQDTEGEVLSRSVTSCAGMTAKVTIIAQTRIGFLSGLRRLSGGEGAEEAYDVQMEEAAARATVALTRAKELCVILGPLDMLGLIGAATVIGSLMYGVGICWRQDLELHYQHKELAGDMDDEQMVRLKAAGPCSDLPPLALAEVVHLTDEEFQVRRLHLIIVDMWRQKWLPDRTVDLLRRSMRTVTAEPLTLNTTPIRLSASSGRRQHQVRFTYGYALDGSTYPCYCVYPERAGDHSYQLVDSATGYIMAISQTVSMRPLGVTFIMPSVSTKRVTMRINKLSCHGLTRSFLQPG